MKEYLNMLKRYKWELLLSLLLGCLVGILIAIWRDDNFAIALCTIGAGLFRLISIRRMHLQKEKIKNRLDF